LTPLFVPQGKALILWVNPDCYLKIGEKNSQCNSQLTIIIFLMERPLNVIAWAFQSSNLGYNSSSVKVKRQWRNKFNGWSRYGM